MKAKGIEVNSSHQWCYNASRVLLPISFPPHKSISVWTYRHIQFQHRKSDERYGAHYLFPFDIQPKRRRVQITRNQQPLEMIAREVTDERCYLCFCINGEFSGYVPFWIEAAFDIRMVLHSYCPLSEGLTKYVLFFSYTAVVSKVLRMHGSLYELQWNHHLDQGHFSSFITEEPLFPFYHSPRIVKNVVPLWISRSFSSDERDQYEEQRKEMPFYFLFHWEPTLSPDESILSLYSRHITFKENDHGSSSTIPTTIRNEKHDDRNDEMVQMTMDTTCTRSFHSAFSEVLYSMGSPPVYSPLWGTSICPECSWMGIGHVKVFVEEVMSTTQIRLSNSYTHRRYVYFMFFFVFSDHSKKGKVSRLFTLGDIRGDRMIHQVVFPMSLDVTSPGTEEENLSVLLGVDDKCNVEMTFSFQEWNDCFVPSSCSMMNHTLPFDIFPSPVLSLQDRFIPSSFSVRPRRTDGKNKGVFPTICMYP